MSSSLERLDAVLKWAEERMKQEEQEERWQMELDGLMFTNHPGDVINKAKDMSPDVARYENKHDDTLDSMIYALKIMREAEAHIVRAIDIARNERR